MKITAVKKHVLGTSWRNNVFIEVETDEGITGIGEASVANREEASMAYLDIAVERYVIGADPFNTEAIWWRMFTGDFIRGGPVAGTVMSAVDIACWDIKGKALGVPVYKLLGGAVRPRIKCYANGWYTAGRTPEAVADRAQVVLDKGYKAMKIDPFGPGYMELSRDEFNLSIDIIRKLREAVGPDIEILVEGHGRFSPSTAVKVGKALEEFEPSWFEEPLPWDHIDRYHEVRAKVNIPISGGEHFQTRFGCREMFEKEAVDIFQPDVLYFGGITEMKKAAATAETHSVLMAPHNSYGPVCTTASAHLDFSTNNFKIQEVFDDFNEPHVLEAVPGTPRVVNGYIELPDKPGLGIELDKDVIAAHPYKKGHFDLWAEGWEKRSNR